ncbi:hypothetical protein Efla_000935 [Eimeria flavescens]
MADSEVTLAFVQGLAESVGPLILEGFGCGCRSSEGPQAGAPKTKASAADLVTEFDVKVEEYLKSAIKSKFPSHTFLCEECMLKNVEFVATHCRDIRHMGSTAMELCYLGSSVASSTACRACLTSRGGPVVARGPLGAPVQARRPLPPEDIGGIRAASPCLRALVSVAALAELCLQQTAFIQREAFPLL